LFKKLLVICAVSAAALLIACGGDDDGDDSSPGSGAAADGGTIEVAMVDFGYRPETLAARAGQALTINLSNEGVQPHTFTINGVVDSQQVAAGQSKTITFTPNQAGMLTFICTVHGQAAMSGTLTVS
jgi:cytochrome c oxidase subunit 2